MKIILTMAISANSMIASKTGSEDFLPHANWTRFIALANQVGCFIWGRKTYEAVIKWEGDYLAEIEGITKVIISRSKMDLKNGFELADSPEEAIKLLEGKGFSQAIITGGSTINTEFAQRGLIDEVVLDVNPSILGEGIPIFSPSEFELPLELVGTEQIDGGIVELRYKVKK